MAAHLADKESAASNCRLTSKRITELHCCCTSTNAARHPKKCSGCAKFFGYFCYGRNSGTLGSSLFIDHKRNRMWFIKGGLIILSGTCNYRSGIKMIRHA